MITKEEAGLTQEQYNSLTSETGDSAFQFILEAYSLSVSTVSQVDVGTGAVDNTIDAIVCDGTIVRVWNGTDEINVGLLASEDASDQAWSEDTFTATDLSTDVAPSLAASGQTVRCFWYDGSDINYNESVDEGANWGATQTVATVANVEFLAAVTLNRVHYMRRSAKDNLQLCVASYSGSWSTSNSLVYWPFTPTSFDAVLGNQLDDGAAATNDIIAMSSDFPPLTARRVDGTELVTNLERVQGIAVFRYQNGKWSDHVEVDMMDNVPSTLIPARTNVRLTKYGQWIFMTYLRRDGSADYSHATLVVSRSRTGLHWEMPYVLQSSLVGTHALLLKNGKYAYLVDSRGIKARSYSCGYVGAVASDVSHDLSEYVISVDIQMGDIAELQVTLGNPAGALDSILDVTRMWRMHLRQGYTIDSVDYIVRTITADLNEIGRSAAIPTDHRVLTGTDELGRMNVLRADRVQEWENQQMGGDNFESLDGTKYSGLRHTAGMAGHWECHDNILQLRSGSNPGVGFNLQTSDAWNGSAQAAISVAATDTDDYAGIAFRGFDQYNLWHVSFNSDSGAVSLIERRENEDTAHDSVSVASWVIDTFYWLKVRFRYNYVWVYQSADGITWTDLFSYELTGVAADASWTYDNIPIMRGSMGYVGHGYSEYNPSYTIPPWDPLPIELPEVAKWPEECYVAMKHATEGGVWYSDDFGGPDDDMPTWTKINTGLLGNYNVIHMQLDPSDPGNVQYILVEDGANSRERTIYRRINKGNWVPVLTTNPVLHPAVTTLASAQPALTREQNMFSITVDRANPDHIWVFCKSYNVIPGDFSFAKSIDRGATWGGDGFLISTTATTAGNLRVHDGAYIFTFKQGGTYIFEAQTSLKAPYDPDPIAAGVKVGNVASAWCFLNSIHPPLLSPYLGVLSTGSDLGRLPTGQLTSWEVVQEDQNIWPSRQDSMWLSNVDFGRMWLVGYNDNKIYSTEDSWSSITIGPAMDKNINSIQAPVILDEDMLILGQDDAGAGNPDTIYVKYGLSGSDLTGRSGPNPDSSPYTDSIPWDAGTLAQEGIQPVKRLTQG